MNDEIRIRKLNVLSDAFMANVRKYDALKAADGDSKELERLESRMKELSEQIDELERQSV